MPGTGGRAVHCGIGIEDAAPVSIERLAALIGGQHTQEIVAEAWIKARQHVAKGAVQGGGPLESFIRIVKQQNVTTQLEPGLTTTIVQSTDHVFMTFMTSITSLLPNFKQFSNVNYVAHGFDIPPDAVLIQLCTAAGYVAAVFAIGYFFLRTREVAR